MASVAAQSAVDDRQRAEVVGDAAATVAAQGAVGDGQRRGASAAVVEDAAAVAGRVAPQGAVGYREVSAVVINAAANCCRPRRHS